MSASAPVQEVDVDLVVASATDVDIDLTGHPATAVIDRGVRARRLEVVAEPISGRADPDGRVGAVAVVTGAPRRRVARPPARTTERGSPTPSAARMRGRRAAARATALPDDSLRDDAELVGAARRGEPGAFDQLVVRYSGMVHAVARRFRLDRDTVADVAQTTWLRLAEHIDGLRSPESVRGWLAVTARNEALRAARRQTRTVPLAADEEIDRRRLDEPSPDDDLLDAERDSVLWEAVDRLPCRCVALLRLLSSADRPSYAEVSDTLHMPVGSIGPTRQRCLECLRRESGRRLREMA